MVNGSIVAIITPFNEDLTINYDKLTELLNWHIEEGTDGIVILGTTGEAATLTKTEKIAVFKHTVEVVNQRIPVIAGTGSNNTKDTIELSQEAEAIGVDGLLLVSPYYNRSNNKGLYHHFNAVATSVSIPIILYNVPSRTGINIPVSVVKDLADVDNIIGLKEASGNLSYSAKVEAATPTDFLLYSGNDDVVLPILSLGGAGVISVVANVIPKEFSSMVHEYLAGNMQTAKTIQLNYLDLINVLFIENNPIPVKEVLNQLGKNVGGYRLPLFNISEKNKNVIKETLTRYKL